MEQMEGPIAVSVDEAARRLGISRSHAYERVANGALPSIRLGARVLVPIAGLERLVGRSLEPTEPPAGRSTTDRRRARLAPTRSSRQGAAQLHGIRRRPGGPSR